MISNTFFSSALHLNNNLIQIYNLSKRKEKSINLNHSLKKKKEKKEEILAHKDPRSFKGWKLKGETILNYSIRSQYFWKSLKDYCSPEMDWRHREIFGRCERVVERVSTTKGNVLLGTRVKLILYRWHFEFWPSSITNGPNPRSTTVDSI